MHPNPNPVLDALIEGGYDRNEAKERIRDWERMVCAAFVHRIDQRIFGPRGEANWYHVVNPAGDKEWVLRGSKVKAILEEEAKR